MFIAAPITIAKTWKQPKCPWTEEWIKKMWYRTSLVVQWLRLCTSNAGGVGSIPGQGAKLPHAVQHCQKNPKQTNKQKKMWGASLVAQWLRIRLPVQGTWVWALVREDPMCRRATKPACHNCWVCTLEPVLCNKRSHWDEKPTHCNEE